MVLVNILYEGLIQYVPYGQYVPEKKMFAPQLATAWEVSKDQLTYTFHLRPNVKFHDGTPANAQAWVASFERRLKRNQGPAYMIQAVEKATAPDDTTFVVKLKQLNNAFLHYLACPWRPFAVSPTAIAKYAKNGDLGVNWLTTHDAGTGPYTLTDVTVGTSYTMDYFKGWWGPKPAVTQVVVPVIPDVNTRLLEIQSGSLNIVPQGFSYGDLLTLKKTKSLTTSINHVAGMLAVYFNLNSGILKDDTLRAAVMCAIDRKAVLDAGYDGFVTPSTSFFSDQVVNAADYPYNQQYDPSVLQQWVKANGSRPIVVGYGAGNASYVQMAETIQVQLQAAGLQATTRVATSAEAYAFNTDVKSRPDLYLMTNWSTGDALNLDTGLRIEIMTGSQLLNWFAYSNPQVDTEMNAALQEPTLAGATKRYQKISQLIQADHYVLPLGNDINGFVSQGDIGGVVTDPYLQYMFKPEKLTFAG